METDFRVLMQIAAVGDGFLVQLQGTLVKIHGDSSFEGLSVIVCFIGMLPIRLSWVISDFGSIVIGGVFYSVRHFRTKSSGTSMRFAI